MKKLLITFFAIFSMLAFGQNTPGEVDFSVRTVTNGAKYSPKHVLAAWVEDSEGQFVKTLKLRADRRKQYLYTWNATSNGNTVDAVTGATISSHATHQLAWDCTNTSGEVVPDGDYQIVVEYTSAHAPGPMVTVSFTKAVEDISLQPANKTYFKDMSLDYTAETVYGQTRAFEINEKLGRGINFGNMFESPKANGWGAEVYEYFFEEIADKGFNSIRVPIKWSDYALPEAPFTIEQEFIDTIKTVVDLALKYNLLVVINMHHYDEIFDDPDGHTERFLALWDQISLEFKDYSDSLIFELLNEPHNNLNQAKWNAMFPIALDTVRKDNPTRIVIVGPPDWNGISSVNKLDWPVADTNLIMTVHYYNPFEFTHQGAEWVDNSNPWLGTTWDSTSSQRQAVINDFQQAVTFSETYNVPVYVGEFGSYSTADMDSRKAWTAFVSRTIESFGFSWAYWEFKGGFGAYDPGNGFWRNELLYGLTEQLDPNARKFEPWEVSNPSFERGLLGWSLYAQGGAEATSSVISEEVRIAISNIGTASWNIQLAQTGIELIEGATYNLSFDARSDEPYGDISASVGRNSDPYNSYSGSHNYTLAGEMTNYNFDFTMDFASDPGARVVFNLANDATTLYFDNIILTLLSMPTLVQSITLGPESATIEVKNGALQLTSEILPEDATNKDLNWEIIAGSELATVSSTGKVTANGSADGTVTVRATADDGSGISDELDISISNQTLGISNDQIDNYFATWRNNSLIISYPATKEGISLSIYSLSGQRLFDKKLLPYSSELVVELDFQSGLYLLKFDSENGRHLVKAVKP